MKDQKQLENEEYFYCVGSMITNYARCTPEIKLGIAAAEAAFNSFHLQIKCNFKEQTTKVLHLGMALHGAETWRVWKVIMKLSIPCIFI